MSLGASIRRDFTRRFANDLNQLNERQHKHPFSIQIVSPLTGDEGNSFAGRIEHMPNPNCISSLHIAARQKL
jgi:hypothetical protein